MTTGDQMSPFTDEDACRGQGRRVVLEEARLARAVLWRNVRRQFRGELRCGDLPASAGILARPQGREVPAPEALRPGAQRGDGPCRLRASEKIRQSECLTT